MRIGVLALQGDFAEHIHMLARLGVETREVRLPADLADLDGLIIPGGESTTIGKLAVDFGLLEPLKEFGRQKPVWGTCAGAIFLSKDATRAKNGQPLLGLMEITIQRNAFGRQVDSFETELEVPALAAVSEDNPPYSAVFIRAPLIETVNEKTVEVLATVDDDLIVAARQGHLLATSFHPELTEDNRFHRYFLSLVSS
jgi:5'-phosphate synthase pdxT subunit